MANIVSIRYANALFNVARELDSLERIGKDFESILDLIDKEDRLKQFIDHPQVTNKDKKDILSKLFEEKVSRELLNFLYILIDKKRFKSIYEIYKEYNALKNKEKNIAVVDLKTAYKLDEKQEEAIRGIISKKIKKDIMLNIEKDESIIGGAILRIGDKVIDGSIASQLKDLEKELKRTKVS